MIVFLLAVAPHANLVVLAILRYADDIFLPGHGKQTVSLLIVGVVRSAFFWVCSMCAVSLVWMAVPVLYRSLFASLLLAVASQV